MKYSRKFPAPRADARVNRIQRRLDRARRARRPAARSGGRAAAAGVLPEPAEEPGSTRVGSRSAGQSAKPRTLLKGGEELVLETELEAAVPVAPEADSAQRRACRRGAARDRQARRASSCIRAPATARARCRTRCCICIPSSRCCRVRASCTGSTRTRADCCSSRARSQSQTALSAALERREIKRTYRAICQGVLTGGGNDRRADRPASPRAHEDGRRRRRARRRARTTACSSGFARTRTCEVELETGRTHQIRVHMAHIRAPLARRSRLRRPSALAAARRATSSRPRCRASGARRCTRAGSRFAHPATRRRARVREPAAAGSRALARRCCARTRRRRDERGAARLRARLAGAVAACAPGSPSAAQGSGRYGDAEPRDTRRRRAGRGRGEPRAAACRARAAVRARLARSGARRARARSRHRSHRGAADGAVTARAGVVCAVLTADCLPVLLCDRGGPAGRRRARRAGADC